MFTLLNPEWQGFGLSATAADGARALASAWWPEPPDLTIDCPSVEMLEVGGGVLGLESIADRCSDTLALLRERRPSRLTSVGGTCGVELAPVSYLNDHYGGDLAVLWLDAHADLNTPASSPSGHFHGMALRTLLGEGPAMLTSGLPRTLVQRQVCLVGARDLDPPERDFVETSDVTWMRDEVFADPRTLTNWLRDRGFGHVYLHFDVDIVNPDDFGSALMHAPGGPSLAVVADVIADVHRHADVVGFSVLEYVDRGRADRDRLVTVLRAADTRSCC